MNFSTSVVSLLADTDNTCFRRVEGVHLDRVFVAFFAPRYQLPLILERKLHAPITEAFVSSSPYWFDESNQPDFEDWFEGRDSRFGKLFEGVDGFAPSVLEELKLSHSFLSQVCFTVSRLRVSESERPRLEACFQNLGHDDLENPYCSCVELDDALGRSDY